MATYDLAAAEERFAWRMKVIRSFYGLTMQEMANLLGYRGAANINFMENYPLKNRPKFHFLVKLQQLFGISLDWLIGDNELPYTNVSIDTANRKLRDRLESLDLSFIPVRYPREATLQLLMKDMLENDDYTAISYEDQAVMTFLMQYFDYKLCQYYKDIEEGKQPESFLVLNDKNEITDRKHPEYISLLNQIHKSLGTTRDTSVLDDRWDLAIYGDRFYE